MNYIQLDFPLSRPHCGLPMANGNLGILIWGDKTLNLTVNRSDFWDHRGGENIVEGTRYDKLAEFTQKHGFSSKLNELILSRRRNWEVDFLRPQRIPVGRFELNFGENVKPVSIRLNYETGEAAVSLSDGAELKINISLQSHVVFIDDPGRSIQEVHGRPSWEFRKSKAWLSRFGFQPPELLPDGWKINCPDPADGSLTVRCTRQGEGYVLSTDNASDDREETLRNNRIFWKKFWSDVPELEIPDPFYAKLFRFNIYKFASATHPNGVAAGLQGPWHEEYQEAQWSGDFHFNVNVQMIYGAALSLGICEHLLPLFDMIESVPFQESLRHNARQLFGIDDALWFTHAVDDRGQQCGGLSCGSVLDPACGAWTALLYYGYWKHTGDVAFLRKRAFPFIRGTMRGYEAMLDKDFNIPVAISAEYAASNLNGDTAGRNPSYQLAAMRKLAQILVELSGVLELPPEKIWLDVLERLPEYTLVEGYDASSHNFVKRIGIWEGQDLANCHRHHSHLACLYPFDSLPENLSQEQQEILETSIDHWIATGEGQWSEWCYPWAFILLARMGISEAPMVMMDVWRKHFINEGLCTVYLPRFRGMIAHRRLDIPKPKEENEIMQLDGAMGFISALIEMSAYKKGSTIYLFRGIPAEWKDYSFRNLPLPGGYRISARRGGEIAITGPKEEILRVHADGKVSECRVRPR